MIADASRVRTTVDRFLLAKLEKSGLNFSPDANRATLLRRVYLDLTGLPPSPAETEEFLADRTPKAFERRIDRLLQLPHFGERWGRHWLDVAGYVDTYGREIQAKAFKLGKGKWRYRDYVIRSFNSDKPYDRFLVEQIAGDELVDWHNAEKYTPEIREMLVATGFLRTAEDPTDSPERDIALHRYGVLQDTLKILTSNVLGLTVACAQCHDHKFEPIPQRDYYRLMAVFTPAYNPQNWRPPQDRILPDVSKRDRESIDRFNEELDKRKRPLDEQLAALRRPYEDRLLDEKLEVIPEEIRRDVKAAVQTPAKRRDDVQKYLAAKFKRKLAISRDELLATLTDDDRSRAAALEAELEAIESRKMTYGEIHALFDVGADSQTYLLRRGDFESPGPKVKPGILAVLDEPDKGFSFPAPAKDASSSGRRLAFARWLTDAEGRSGALAARVMVNRIWRHLFGEGIVATPENLGRSGAAPTHPELLEWLAAEFVASGWRIKPLLKLIMTSTVYRQASRRDDDGTAVVVDPENKLLWRMRLRRLESEAIRDSILAVSGMLDRTAGGPAVMIETHPSGLVAIKESALRAPGERFRRSVYLVQRRNNNLTMLTVFDQPIMRTNCTGRDSSAVVSQSLVMLNDAFVLEQARRFAERIVEFAGTDRDRRIGTAFRLALARPPSAEETAWSRRLLERESSRTKNETERLAALAHVLFNTSEFLYVE